MTAAVNIYKNEVFPMKTMKKLICIWCTLMLVLCTVGCSFNEEQPAEPRLLLGFSQVGSESAWRIGNTKSRKYKGYRGTG